MSLFAETVEPEEEVIAENYDDDPAAAVPDAEDVIDGGAAAEDDVDNEAEALADLRAKMSTSAGSDL